MDKTKETKVFRCYINIAKMFFGVAVFLMVVFLLFGELIMPDERDTVYKDCQVFHAQWQQILEDGSRIPVEVPEKIPAEWGEVITLVTTVPSDIRGGECICFRPVWQDVDIYVDGELRISYDTEESRPFGKNSAFRYLMLKLKETDAGKELVYAFSSESKYAGNMRSGYIGDEMSIWTHLITTSGLRTVVTVFLLLMSFFCIIVCAILSRIYKINLPLKYLAWTICLCSLWTLSEIEFRQLLIKNVSIMTCSTYWTLMLIPIPLLLYINELQDGRYKKIFIVPLFYSCVVTVVGTVLQVFNVVEFVQQLPFIHGGVVISIVCIIATICNDFFFKKRFDYLAVGIGVFGLLVTAVIEVILYYVGSSLSLGTVLAVGLLFLLVMAIIKTGQDLLRSERGKQQAITAREAQAKFLANMSHEIRTPINAVIGMNEMILRENNNVEVQEYARNIQSASNMLLALVNDILDFTKIESGQLELIEDTYSLAPLIKDELLLLNARATGKPISVQIDIDPYIPSGLWGDELRIKQILTNLLSNAVKYTPEGIVTFKAFFKWIDAENIELCFSVIDTGVGIKQEDLANLFDSFKRLELNKNRNVEGTGLGLNITKQLVDLMQGTITVESEYGKGSDFTISIPQKIMDKKPLGNLESCLKEVRKENKDSREMFTAPNAKVLVVDDNSMNLSVIKGLLKRTKIQLDLAVSGSECIELCKHSKYHVILMDHMMPDMDGVQTLHALRNDQANPNQNTKVIALTANAIAGCREMYLEYGFNDYISKPIQAERLERLLMEHLPERLLHKEGVTKLVSGEAKEDELLVIDHALGLSYSLDSEDIYKDILEAFCEQSREYLPLLEKYYTEQNWEQYAIIAHALKGNSLNIGAANFSKLSLQHEHAAKEQNEAYILAEYAGYVEALKRLMEKCEEIRG